MTSVVLIGYGAIARMVVDGLARTNAGARVVGVLVPPAKMNETRAALPRSIEVIPSPDKISAIAPDLVVECAGQPAVREYGEAILAAGFDLMVISTGALADADVRSRLTETARRNGARILLPAGAIAGIDGLAALRLGGLDSVRYTSTKPPEAWRGTPAEETVDLDQLTEPAIIFAGSADAAARLYPKNANLAATVALTSLGFAETEVRLVADPNVSENVGCIEAAGPFGRLRVELSGRATSENPKTSAITALSILHAIENLGNTLVI